MSKHSHIKEKHHHDKEKHHHDKEKDHHSKESEHDEGKEKVRMQKEMPLEQGIAYIEQILEQLKAGQVSLQHEEQHIALIPAEEVFVKVSASQHGGKEKLSFSLHWYTYEEEHKG